MTIEFKQLGNYNGNIVNTILTNREIKDIHLFLNPDGSSNSNPFDIENIIEAIRLFAKHVSINSRMAIVVDADADGFMSSSMMYQYAKSINSNLVIDYIIHESKAHGLSDQIMTKLSAELYDLVIIPDAGSNDGEQIKKLYELGSEVIVLDHHIIEEMSEFGVIVNNQLGDKANKNLVGAGVVLKFCQAIDTAYKINNSEKLIDLAAVGQVADASDISENEVRNLVFAGIKNLNNKFLKEALIKKEMMFPVPKDLSFSVIPMINAVIRVGTLEEKELLFRAINDIDPQIYIVDKKKKNKETKKFDKIKVNMNLQQYAVDTAIRCKARQDAAVKKAVIQAEANVWNDGGVAIIVTEVEEKFASLTGLIATKMVNKLQKPVLLLRDKDKSYSGSGRGYEKTMSSLKDWCQDTNAVEFAQGHDQAFGLKLALKDLDLIKTAAKKVTARDFCYEVDYVSHGEVDVELIREVDKYKYIFGGRVNDPLFAYVGIEISKNDIRTKGTILSFFKNGVEFVMYGTTPEYQAQFVDGFDRSHTLDFIGRPGVNNWLGKESEQIVLEAVDFTAEETEDEITEFNIIF